MALFVSQLCFALTSVSFASGLLSRYGAQSIGYDIKDWNGCLSTEFKIVSLYGIAIGRCVYECHRRSACRSLNYIRVLKKCDLFSTEEDMTGVEARLEEGPCIFVLRSDMQIKNTRQSCNCWTGQRCDPTNNQCQASECERLVVPNAEIDGNMNRIGAKLVIKCNDGFRELSGRSSIQCILSPSSEAIWTFQPQCVDNSVNVITTTTTTSTTTTARPTTSTTTTARPTTSTTTTARPTTTSTTTTTARPTTSTTTTARPTTSTTTTARPTTSTTTTARPTTSTTTTARPTTTSTTTTTTRPTTTSTTTTTTRPTTTSTTTTTTRPTTTSTTTTTTRPTTTSTTTTTTRPTTTSTTTTTTRPTSTTTTTTRPTTTSTVKTTDIECGSPPELENGYSFAKADVRSIAGTERYYRCHTGFTVIGQLTPVVCSDDGRWSDVTFKCATPTIGEKCSDTTECVESNAVCTSSMCFCNQLSRYNADTHDCDQVCSTMLPEFDAPRFSTEILSNSLYTNQPVKSISDCEELCRSDAACLAYQISQSFRIQCSLSLLSWNMIQDSPRSSELVRSGDDVQLVSRRCLQ